MGNRFREKVVEEGLENSSIPEPSLEKGEEQVESVETDTSLSSEEKEGKVRPSDKAARGIGKVLGGDVLADKLVLKQIPLVLLCLVYLLLIVSNRYRVESLSREKAATEERINYLREHRIQMQKQYQQSVKISQIAEDLKETGVGITSGPPYEIEN
ncbi:MAG: hypothetical protein IKS44_00805 [Bacteroidales bacterium]|nr:hypothetical protein [Bacteroidales bacterium]